MIKKHLVGPAGEQFPIAEDAIVFERAVGGVICQIEVPPTCVAGFQGEAQPLLALAQIRLDRLQEHPIALLPVQRRHCGTQVPVQAPPNAEHTKAAPRNFEVRSSRVNHLNIGP